MNRAIPAAAASCLLLVTLTPAVRAEVVEVGPSDDAEAAMNALRPGDELVLQGGTYSLSGRFGVTIRGTEAAPILIRAKGGERPHFRRDSADQNVIDVDLAEYATIRGVEVSGGSAGLRLGDARFLTIEECEIHDTGDVALRANDAGVLYDTVRILRNHIHHTNNTGEGMYLGCNSNGCRFANGLIEGNHVHHTNQASVDQGDGIELKEGSYGNVIRDNVIHDTRYPCILTYSTAGNGPANVIERNLLFGCGDHGIQSAADAVIRNNVILGAGSDGIAMQPHQSGSPANLVVVHNTVLDSDGDALSLRGAVGSVVIANNALFTSGATALLLNGSLDSVTVAGNVIQGAVSGPSAGTLPGDLVSDFVAATFSGTPPNDVFPKAGGALVAGGDAAHVAADDFNGSPRAGVADVGAYAFVASGNPGWPLGEGLKPVGGVGSGGGGAGGSGAGGGVVGSGGASGDGGRGEGGASGAAGSPGDGGGPGAGGGANAGGAAGAPGDGASVGGAGGDGEAGGAVAGAVSRDDSGCGCRTARHAGARPPFTRSGWGAIALGLGVGAALLRRRRRRDAELPSAAAPLGSRAGREVEPDA